MIYISWAFPYKQGMAVEFKSEVPFGVKNCKTAKESISGGQAHKTIYYLYFVVSPDDFAKNGYYCFAGHKPVKLKQICKLEQEKQQQDPHVIALFQANRIRVKIN